MSIIPGVKVNWRLSPRVITVPKAETQVVIADYQDTLLDLEDNDEGILHDDLRATSGGEDLGAGVTVGWTMEMQNAITAFEPRTTSIESGTVTTPDTAGKTLIDSTALFQTNGVLPGAHVINFTDGSVTSVISVDSETQLTMYPLDDGSDNQWDNADVYKVWNVDQCELAGGNNVAVDELGSPIIPILPTWGTQVLKTSSSSATLQELSAIQYSSFNGGVTLDQYNGYPGTEFPTGTIERKSDNLLDSLAIAQVRGFNTIYLDSSYIFTTGHDVSNFIIKGESLVYTMLEILSGAVTNNTIIKTCTVEGTLDGGNQLVKCRIGDLSYVNGIIDNCGLGGIITLAGNQDAYFKSCRQYSMDAYPIINLGGSGQDLVMTNFTGSLTLENNTGSDVGIGMDGGRIILDTATFTGGFIHVSGLGELRDELGNNIPTSTWNGVTVVNELISQPNIARAVWNSLLDDFDVLGTFGNAVCDLLGLSGENIKWSNITHDASHLMTGARITSYTDNTLVTPEHSWDVTATYNVDGEITAYQMVTV